MEPRVSREDQMTMTEWRKGCGERQKNLLKPTLNNYNHVTADATNLESEYPYRRDNEFCYKISFRRSESPIAQLPNYLSFSHR